MSARLAAAAALNANRDVADPPPVPHVALVREAVATLAWGTMTYACDTCGFEWEVWLGFGVEGPPALREPGLYVPAPFTLSDCPAWPVKPDATEADRARFAHLAGCDGTMSHVRWSEDRELAPELIPDDAPRFVLDTWADCAQLVMTEPALIRARRYHADREDRGTP